MLKLLLSCFISKNNFLHLVEFNSQFLFSKTAFFGENHIEFIILKIITNIVCKSR